MNSLSDDDSFTAPKDNDSSSEDSNSEDGLTKRPVYHDKGHASMLDGPAFGGPPLSGRESQRLQEFFSFITDVGTSAQRKKIEQSTLQFRIPKSVHQELRMNAFAQESSLTEVLVRYAVAHNDLSYRTSPYLKSLFKGAGSVLETPPFGGPPLKGPEGKRLWEMFAFITAPPRPEDRKAHEKMSFGFKIPEPVHIKFKQTTNAQGLSMAEVLTRYSVVHNILSGLL